jgi:large subunit ribosomal protein L30
MAEQPLSKERNADDAILVTQVKSTIGVMPKHRGTLRALGLRGIGQQNVLPDRKEIRGMLARVAHLVRVENASAKDLEEKKAGRHGAA